MAKNNKKHRVSVKSQPKPQSQQTLKQQQKQNQKQKKTIKSRMKPKSKTPIVQQQDEDPILFGSGSGSESDSPPASPTRLQSLLEPYTKPQLIDFLLDVAPSDPDLSARIRSLADSDPSHREIFVYGLGWEATKDDLVTAFAAFGPVEDCSVVVDKNTGRSKGYGFVRFMSRAAAFRALKEPQKKIGNRMASCQLASVGGAKSAVGRKIYVSNVRPEVSPERLREFFAKFGEIESGPWGFDAVTGKSKGYAIFVYKTQEDAKKALEEPSKVFEGQQLHCKIATQVAAKVPVPMSMPLPVPPPVQAVVPAVAAAGPAQHHQQQQHHHKQQQQLQLQLQQQQQLQLQQQQQLQLQQQQQLQKQQQQQQLQQQQQQLQQQQQQQHHHHHQQQHQQQQQSVLAAVAAAQNLALFGQNPAYAALLAQNPLLAAAAFNPGLASALGGGLMNAAALGGVPYGGGGQSVHGAAAQSVHGAYSAGQGMPAVGLQGLQGYYAGSSSQAGQMSSSQAGQMSSSQAGQMPSGKAGGALGGYGYDVMKQDR